MTTPATSALTLATAPAAAMPQPKAIGADFDTFVKLLVTQVHNQDPLSPQGPTQYTQQLATFSQLEQTVSANRTLSAILDRLGSDALGAAAPLIGREVQGAGGAWMRVDRLEMTDGAVALRGATGGIALQAVTGVR